MSIIDDSYDINAPYFQNHSYIEWLESFTIDETMRDDRRPTYHGLVMTLWNIEYNPKDGGIGNDLDRMEEGLELRIRYDYILSKNAGLEHEMVVHAASMFGPCRVLEVIITLAMHMYDMMQDTDIYNSVSRWFWEIMANVGLDDLDDSIFGQREASLVEKTVGDILDRKGPKGARGGWFYVEDWQEIEVWYQMHEYLNGMF